MKQTKNKGFFKKLIDEMPSKEKKNLKDSIVLLSFGIAIFIALGIIRLWKYLGTWLFLLLIILIGVFIFILISSPKKLNIFKNILIPKDNNQSNNQLDLYYNNDIIKPYDNNIKPVYQDNFVYENEEE